MAASITFDTLAFVKKMRAAGFTETQAEAQAEALREIIEERLTTKQDLKDLEMSLTLKIEGLRGDLIAEMANIKAETIKWVAGLLVAQAAVIAALVKLL
ncbi:MAG TPA: hypothetical protein PLH54_04235 [Syntrophales bacterium]|jgi:hypothetical protein|nr:hypothetical protein [Syntrophales bacterium]HON23205.1 hypothetical protein [Syntrophales bacterium]HOU77674.1 hypothetical protein [Syntrophales bacterium]HQI34923.1 hypothetical protein [Syntrophales bacterium]HQJ31418.1 hypothetical protein [Syntrophales bacterium]